MNTRPVLEPKKLKYLPVTEYELDRGIEWAKTQYEKDVARSTLRIIFNTAEERRVSRPGQALPDQVEEIVRECVPFSDKLEVHKRPAYKGAAMKIFSERSARRSKRRARLRRASGAPAPPRKKDRSFTEDPRPKYKGQFVMFRL